MGSSCRDIKLAAEPSCRDIDRESRLLHASAQVLRIRMLPLSAKGLRRSRSCRENGKFHQVQNQSLSGRGNWRARKFFSRLARPFSAAGGTELAAPNSGTRGTELGDSQHRTRGKTGPGGGRFPRQLACLHQKPPPRARQRRLSRYSLLLSIPTHDKISRRLPKNFIAVRCMITASR